MILADIKELHTEYDTLRDNLAVGLATLSDIYDGTNNIDKFNDVFNYISIQIKALDFIFKMYNT